ncbi:MAG TPA: thioesterase domain-containing protein, partial [Chloroflexota bacterium]|nr:thioesterase domain-containing protein [Chloroflexota bacterium]
MGATVAFEMARQLEQQGQRVAALVLLDGRAPVADLQPTAVDDADYAMLFGLYHQLPVSYEILLSLQAEEQLDYLLTLARRATIVPPGTGRAQLARLVGVHTANIKALQAYRGLAVSLHTRVHVFRASIQPPGAPADPAMGWGRLLGENPSIHTVPGDHFTMLYPPHVKVLAHQVRACLGA